MKRYEYSRKDNSAAAAVGIIALRCELNHSFIIIFYESS